MNASRTNWEDQRAFLAVLESGSFSAAARRLGLTQPTVRTRIDALEQSLGVVLFTRTTNGLVPTEQARDLGRHARAMELESEAMIRSASSIPGEVAGTVRLSVGDFIGVEVIPPMLLTLRERYPKIEIELVLDNATADVLGQEADVAIRMVQPQQQSLVARKVGNIALAFFAHCDYLARHGTPATVADLTGHHLVGPDRSASDLAMAATVAGLADRRSFALRTDSHPAQLAAVRAGLGIGAVQRPLGRRLPELLAVLPNLVLHRFDTWIVMHEDMRKVPRMRAVFDHLAEQLADYCAEPPA